METIPVYFPGLWRDYELVDSGLGEKLERYGKYIVTRPDPRIIWQKAAPADIWIKADAAFIRAGSQETTWNIHVPPPDPWSIGYSGLKFTLRPTEFKHTGVFPEQAVNWDFIMNYPQNRRPATVLNLFAYTGGSTMAAACHGARVTHVDSAKGSVEWAKRNLIASGLGKRPVRWIVDDVTKFVSRELKRGEGYDSIIMDPPRFGRGSKGEVWKLEKDLPDLLSSAVRLLSANPSYVIINTYTADISPIALGNLLLSVLGNRPGHLERFELGLKESYAGRILPCGICVRADFRA